jgi:DNA-binding transcriptional ArsR family regulator
MAQVEGSQKMKSSKTESKCAMANGNVDLLPTKSLEEAAECLRVLAHPARLRIVDMLMQGAFPVNELAQACELPPNQMSEHLRLLKGHGFLESDRQARTVYYRIINPNLPGIIACIRSNCGKRK